MDIRALLAPAGGGSGLARARRGAHLPVFIVGRAAEGRMCEGPSESVSANKLTLEVVALVGIPASGKTMFYRTRFADTRAHVSMEGGDR